MKTAERDLAKEAAAAKSLRETLCAITDDPETIRDTIEGETSLHETIAACMDSVREDEILILGLTAMAKEMYDRKARIETAVDRKRTAILQAMTIGELPTLKLPDATISVKAVPPKLVITDEAKLPAEFWVASDPRLDRTALKAALKDGREIDGVSLDNGGQTISIRRS